MRPSLGVLGCSLCLVLGCGSGDPVAPPVPLAPAAFSVTPLPLAGAGWSDAPPDFEPVILDAAPDTCDGDVLWIGMASALTHAPPVAPSPFSGMFDDPELEGLAGEVAAFVRPRAREQALSWNYDGPGGTPYFRSRLAAFARPPLLLFDGRVSRERFDEAIRGARNETESPIRIGGVDVNGQRRCAVVLLDAWPEVRRWPGTLLPGGVVEVRTSPDPSALPMRLEGRSEGPGDTDGEVHLVSLRTPVDAPVSSVLVGLGRLRFGDLRYPFLPAE